MVTLVSGRILASKVRGLMEDIVRAVYEAKEATGGPEAGIVCILDLVMMPDFKCHCWQSK